MFRIVIRVQVATIFSFCVAWNKLIPQPDSSLYYEAEEESVQPPKKIQVENKLELAENFTQFLQRKKDGRNKLDEFNLPKDRFAANVWSRLEDNFNNRKLPTPTDLQKHRYAGNWEKLEDEYSKKLLKTTDAPVNNTEKYEDTEYETDIFEFTPEKSNTTDNTIYSNIISFKTTTEMEETEEFQVIKLLEEPEPDSPLTPMRRFAPVKKSLETVIQKRLRNEKIVIGKPGSDFLSPRKVYKIDPLEELSILKHIKTAENSSTVTTQSFILNELPHKITEPTKNNDTKSVINSLLNNTSKNTTPISKESNNEDNRQKNTNDTNRPLSSQRRDIKTSIELNDEHTLKFEKIIKRENEIIDILKRQTVLLEQVAKLLDAKEQEKAVMRSKDAAKDFENLLKEIDKKRLLLKKGSNMTQVAVDSVKEKLKLLTQYGTLKNNTVTATTQKRILPTVKTVIDETEVRKALKNNPHVQRILKIAKKKRTRYLEDAAKYFAQ